MSEKQDISYLPFFRSPVRSAEEAHARLTTSTSKQQSKSIAHDYDDSAFKRHTETTNSELFYDLFFVANLTVFTSVHEVNDIYTFKQYIGFFALLWLTWYQVSLYDVRYGEDSVIDRCAKAVQFGVMIGFAVIGPEYNVGAPTHANSNNTPAWQAFRALCLILMVSRLVLVLQYLQVLFFSRRIRATRLPFLAIAATYTIAAFVYLGLFFTFSTAGSRTYIVWYCIALAEAVTVTAISSLWRVISFKDTHLVQRMSLLTLIFLGEGVIGAARQTQLVFISPAFGPSPVVIGNVVCVVLILYFLYMLYFDWIEEGHFGTIREQIWAFAHFPLHIALVVAVEGIAQFLAWTTAADADDRLAALFNNFPLDNATQEVTNVAIEMIKQAAETIVAEDFAVLEYEEFPLWQISNATIYADLEAAANLTAAAESRAVSLLDVYAILNGMLFNVAGFKPPEENHTIPNGSTDAVVNFVHTADTAARQYKVFVLTFLYTFISVGLVVILIALIAMISKTTKRGAHWTRLTTNMVVGAGLCLISAIASNSYIDLETAATTSYDAFISSGCMLPTILLALLVAVVLSSVRIPSFRGLRLRLPGRRKRR